MACPVPIAVIGMGCRLPGGVNSPEKLWDMLAEGRSGWGEVPSDRWNWKSFYHPNPEAKESVNSKSGYFLDQDVAAFDARFFGIAVWEAHAMDPQQRILLETTYEALENAGIPLQSLKGSDTAVYVGMYARDYDRMGYKDLPQITKIHITGTGEAVVANRISYLFDLKGPSLTIDTGCSGSMVALHQACQSLRTGETTMAIVGGTQLLLHPDQSIPMSMVGMVNPNGRCFVFDSRGSGYARGEGVGTVILKRLDDALKAGDPIHAVIRNSALNQDGKTAGISLPNSDAQAALMRSVYSSAGLDPKDTFYVEAHGTGTQAGDEAEISSISSVFCGDSKRDTELYVGSVKSNIGHLEASSGVAGLIKGIMILKKGKIPPNIDFVKAKESLRLEERQIKIPLELVDLPSSCRVSLNSFGYGGTNAHVILESAPNRKVSTKHLTNGHQNGESNGSSYKIASSTIVDSPVNGTKNGIISEEKAAPKLLLVTAASEKSLRASVKSLQKWVERSKTDGYSLEDLAYTLSFRRSLLPWRHSMVASTHDELAALLSEKNPRATKAAANTRIAFVFTGQGAQWHAMGRELILGSSSFRESILDSDVILSGLGCEWGLLEELMKEESSSRISESEISQPATTAIQVALVDLLASLSIRPQSVCGHSSGEIAAAYSAGALSKKAAIQAAYHRGVWSARAKKINSTKGAMLAVGIGEKEVLPYVNQTKKGIVTVACVNSPSSTTISGDDAAIEELKYILDGLSIFNRKLKVDSAYHSHHMKKVADQYCQSLEDIDSKTNQHDVNFYSSVTGERKNLDFSPAYWTLNLVSKVRFSDALEALTKDLKNSKQSSNTANFFIEIGPHSALAGPLRQTLTASTTDVLKYSYLSALIRNKNAAQCILELAGSLFEYGYPIDMQEVMSLTGSEGPRKIISNLTPYAWDHSATFWHESRLSREHRFREFPYHDLLGLLDVNSNIHEPRWRYHINVDTVPWLRDHVVDGLMIFPGSGYLCMVIEAMKQITQIRKVPYKISKFVLRDITFSKSIIVPEPALDGFTPEIEVQLTLSPSKNSTKWEHFRIFSLSADGLWNEHCSGRVTVDTASKTDEVEGTREEDFENQEFLGQLERIRDASRQTIDPQQFYDDLRKSGNNFGPAFAALKEINVGDCKGFTKLSIPDVTSCMPHSYMQPHIIHPTTFDAINQLSAGLFKLHCSNSPLMPVYMGEVTVSTDMTSKAGDELLIALEIKPEGPRYATGNCWAFQKNEDSTLSPIFTTTDLRLRGIGDVQVDEQDTPFQRRMSYRMEWKPIKESVQQHSETVAPVQEVNGHTEKSLPKVIILSDTGGNLVASKLTEELSMHLIQQGVQCSEASWDKAVVPDATYLILDDLEHPALFHPSPERFEMLKNLFLTTNSVLWISFQSGSSPEINANKGLVTGVARVVRRENEGMKFITLDIQQDISRAIPDVAKAITEVSSTSFWPQTETEISIEYEYVYSNGELLVPRLCPDEKFNNWIDRTYKSSELETALYQQQGRPLKLHVETPGLLSSLRFVNDVEAQEELRPGDFEIETKAYGVNFKDVFIALGQMLPGVNMVGEVAGVVTAVGSDLQSRFKVGDRVVAVGARPFASRARIRGFQACALPDSMPFTIGASIPTVFLTAYQCIVEVARLRKGQSILIHAASGGVGQAAIMFAQHIGAEIFATVGSAAKRQLLIEKYKIPESHIFSTRSRTFKQGILRLTKNKGVNVVLNSLSGEWLSDSWECVARLGTFVEIGKADIYQRNQLSMVPFDRSVTFASVDLVVLFDEQPEEMSERFSRVMSMFESGILSNLEPVTVMPMTNIEDAFRLISSRKHTGKVVLEADENTMVKAVPAKPAPLHLDPTGSYVVAGGMGDLGKRICRLLAIHGAKHIITLSRRTVDSQTLESLMSEFRELGTEIHILNCDIVDATKLEDISLLCAKTFPPVKGVIHAGMVLRDHPLEQMTLEDYSIGLQPKVQGTINLNRAFADSALDFFITLSSVSCILGKTGQMNYSAGNAFQDAFAHEHSKTSSTQYISLNLGAIDGSEAITSLPVRQRELMRQGAILMKFEELFKVLEYSMSSEARRDNCVQCILGFDRQSMEQAGDTFALNNPMFSQIPYLVKTSSGDISTDKLSVEDELLQARSVDVAVEVISKAITEKFALFLNRPIEDLDPDQPPASFGLDSLVSIELKNWMVRTFKVTLQTAEVGDATSIVALATLIASRSKLVRVELQQVEESDVVEEVIRAEPVTLTTEYKGPSCCRFAKAFPKYPLMGLDETLKLLLDDVRPFSSDQEYEEVSAAVEEFKLPGSLGHQTYQKLVERANDPSIDNWLFDLQVEGIWLRRRPGLAPYSNFLATHHNSKLPHSQAERAALIATTAFKFKQAIEENKLEPHWYFGVPSCMDTWQWLFNATREPHVKQDKMRKYPGNDYCVVLRRGHVFKVLLREGIENVNFEKLKMTFEVIVDSVHDEGSWAGILTSDERDSWAGVRQKILSLGVENAKYLSIIDKAAFVICLDDGSPTNGQERVQQCYLGNGFNRWNDKCLQFIVCTNGSSGYLAEHTMIDGLTVFEMNDLIHKAIYEHQPEGTLANGVTNGLQRTKDYDIILEEYTLTTTPDIDNHINLLRSRYITNTSKINYAYHTFAAFGNDLLATNNNPIKAIFDLTIQLASNLYFGHNPASWEPVSMAQFHKGRFAIVQVITSSILTFCTSAPNETIPLSLRRKMLLTAANDYNAKLRNAYNGNAYFRVMNALRVMWPEDQPLASLFREEAWTRTHPRFIMSNMTDGGSLDSAYVMGDPESIWISYTVLADEAKFCVVGPAGGGLEWFLECLDRAGEIVQRIVVAK